MHIPTVYVCMQEHTYGYTLETLTHKLRIENSENRKSINLICSEYKNKVNIN